MEKMEKHQDLARALRKVENENRGDTYCNWYIWTRKVKKGLESIGIETKMDELQKSVILTMARVLRKVLEVEETYMYCHRTFGELKFHWKSNVREYFIPFPS